MELLVAVGVFFVLFLIIMAFVRLAVGQTTTLHTKMLTADLRNTLDTLSVQMNNANGKITVSSGETIYGFRIFNENTPNEILALASFDHKCFYIALNRGTVNVVMDPYCDNRAVPSISSMGSSITSPGINVTGLSFTPNYQMTDTDLEQTPYLRMTITAEDRDAKYLDNKITLQTTYSMDYLTIRRLQETAGP